jgi:ATP-binding cassette subfamily B protein RaxB
MRIEKDLGPQDRALKVRFGWRRKVRPILQTQSSECALACLAMIAEYYGATHDMRDLRAKIGLSSRGLNGAGLVDAAYQMKLQASGVRLEVEELQSLQLPALLHFDMNHCVVLTALSRRKATIIDPACGLQSLDMKQLSQRFTGVAFTASPLSDFQRVQSRRKIDLSELTGSSVGLKRAIVEIVTLAVIVELLGLASPLMMQTIVDKVLPSGNTNLVLMVGVAFATLMVLQAVLFAARSWAMTSLGQQLSFNWISRVYSHLIRLPDSYFGTRHLGDVVSRFDSVAAVQRTLTTRVAEVVLDAGVGSLTLVVMFFYDVRLAIITVMFVLAYAALRHASYSAMNRLTTSEIAVSARQQSNFLESIRGVTAIRLFNRQSAQTARYAANMAKTLEARAILDSIHLTFGTINSLLFGLLRITLLIVGSIFALKGKFSVGMLVAFIAYADRFAERASSLIDFMVDIRMMQMHGERIADITSEPIETHLYGDTRLAPKDFSIELRNVSFRYSQKDAWILKGCSATIASGTSVCIVGSSGVGKSTVAKLLAGMLDPTEGQIFIGGVDVRNLGKTRVRSLLGAVLQEDSLFSGSIAENISFFDEQPSAESIGACARLASIEDDIVRMPMRYETLIGDMGSSLSGGQRQRVLLARALYRSPSILLTDEATSHLDPATEATILANIRSMNVTRVSVAHRIESVRLADRILELRDGTLLEISARSVG